MQHNASNTIAWRLPYCREYFHRCSETCREWDSLSTSRLRTEPINSQLMGIFNYLFQGKSFLVLFSTESTNFCPSTHQSVSTMRPWSWGNRMHIHHESNISTYRFINTIIHKMVIGQATIPSGSQEQLHIISF